MKKSFRFLTIGVALLVLLVSQVAVERTVTAQVDLDQDKVEFTTAAGATKAYFKPGDTANFYLKDDGLALPARSGTGTWTNTAAAVAANQAFDLATGNTAVGGVLNNANAGVFVGTSAAAPAGFNTTNPTQTPLAETPVVTVAGSPTLVVSYGGAADATAGNFKLFTGADAGSTVAATFKYHVQDIFTRDAAAGTTAGSESNRAKVTSTSDTTGEWVQISEVADEGSVVATALSNIYHGSVTLSSSAGAASSASDGAIWVQDGDTLTVTFFDTNHTTAIGTDTALIDDKVPTITGLQPADAGMGTDTSPILRFTLGDDGSGLSTSVPGDNVAVTINGCPVADASLTATSLTATEISMFYRIAAGSTWTSAAVPNCGARTSGGFGIDTTTLGDNNHGASFVISVTATDIAGKTATETSTITVDTVAPDMSAAAVTGTGWSSSDQATEADRKAIKLTFTESLVASTVEAGDFTITNPTIAVDSVTVGGVDTDGGAQLLNEIVILRTAADIPSDAAPTITLTGSVTDTAGNALTSDTGQATDELKPVVTVDSIGAPLLVKAGTTKITFSADENMAAIDAALGAADGCTCIAITGGGSAAGAVTSTKGGVTLNTPSTGEYTFSQATFSDTGIYGAVVQGRDQQANLTQVGTTSVTDEATTTTAAAIGGSTTVALANWPLADTDLDGTVADSVTLKNAAGTNLGLVITSVDWVDGKVSGTVTTAVTAGEAVKASYSYVSASHVIQVDTSAPTVTFAPTGNTQQTKPFIRAFYDETEYAGDGHTTVEVTAATLTNPDGSITTLVGTDADGNAINLLTTGDSKTYSYLPAADLALGAYTLSIDGKDAAGNASGSQTSTFTVVTRALVTVPLGLGWNLISLPGDPTSTAIGTVINVAEVTTVITYDPSVEGGWLTAVRDGSDFVGSLTEIDGNRAYFVYTTSEDDLKVDIPGLTVGSQALPPSVDLAIGWNMVPSVSLDTAFPAQDPDDYFAGLSWSRAYYYDNSASAFVGIVAGGGDAEVILGRGFWLYLRAAGTLVP